ncbi:hypothetical protein M569_04308, partial [Genlisea aurea]
GGYTLHHSLTLEAAAVVKQAVALARRRGHAQVTPLHVASAMLVSSTGLLKRACLESHSHPLQCKALELCFNVALNRLPTSASSPLLPPPQHHHQHHLPSLSNALVAAFKRAQAHQRRGTIENQQQQQHQQQQPVLALKVEIEQLVLSILDDPSVSRVMREAGFSSTQVKGNVEQALSVAKTSRSKDFSLGKTTVVPPAMTTTTKLSASKVRANKLLQHDDDVRLMQGVIERFEKKNIPSDLKHAQFISVPLLTLKNVTRDEFEVKIGELRSLVRSYISRGVVLYVENLDWISSFWSKNGDAFCSSSPVEYMVMELSRLVNEQVENRRIWLMGIATTQTYQQCTTGSPSLEALWNLHPLRVPTSSLALGLGLNSGIHDMVKEEPVQDDIDWLLEKHGIKELMICCSDCSLKFKREAKSVMEEHMPFASTSNLPSWLQQYRDQNTKQLYNADQELKNLMDLCKKWNAICGSAAHRKHHFLEKAFSLSSSSSSSSHSSSASISSNGQSKTKVLHWAGVFEPSQVVPKQEHCLFLHENDSELCSKPNLLSFLPPPKPELLSNPSSSPNSASSSEANEYTETNNFNNLCTALEKKVPWQREIIPDVVSGILRCRSGVKPNRRMESWLLFLGPDSNGKETIGRELAETIFDSHDSFVSIGISSFSNTRDGSMEEVSNKRTRNEHGASVFERFLDAVGDNPSRLFYLEDFDLVD